MCCILKAGFLMTKLIASQVLISILFAINPVTHYDLTDIEENNTSVW